MKWRNSTCKGWCRVLHGWHQLHRQPAHIAAWVARVELEVAKNSSLAEGFWSSPSQLPLVTSCILETSPIYFPGPCLSQGLTWSDTAELEISRDDSLERVVPLQAVAGSVVHPGVGETSSFLPRSLALPFQDTKHCCCREKAQSAGLQWYLHFNYLNSIKRRSTAISQGSFPQSLFLRKEASYSSSLSPNEKNNHLIHTDSSLPSSPDHWSIKKKKKNLNDTRKFILEYFKTLLFRFISNTNTISKMNNKNSPLCSLFEFAYLPQLSWFLGEHPSCKKKIGSSIFICGRKNLWKKSVAWTNEAIHPNIYFPPLLSTSDKQRGKYLGSTKEKGILSEKSQIISGHNIDTVFTL